jgi:hypothetical protein
MAQVVTNRSLQLKFNKFISERLHSMNISRHQCFLAYVTSQLDSLYATVLQKWNGLMNKRQVIPRSNVRATTSAG